MVSATTQTGGECRKDFISPATQRLAPCLWYYQVIRSLSRSTATVKRLIQRIFLASGNEQAPIAGGPCEEAAKKWKALYFADHSSLGVDPTGELGRYGWSECIPSLHAGIPGGLVRCKCPSRQATSVNGTGADWRTSEARGRGADRRALAERFSHRKTRRR